MESLPPAAASGDTLSMDTFAFNLPEGNYTFNAFNLGVPNACPDTTIGFSILTPQIDVYSVFGDTICAGTTTSFSLQTSNTDSSYIYRAVIGSDIFYEDDTSQLYSSGWYSYSVEIDTGDGFMSCFLINTFRL